MKKYGLIGKTLQHSFSKKYFSEKFEKEQLFNVQYELFEIDSIDKISKIREIKNLQGLNVTIPYKHQIIKYLDKIDPIAQEISAVNTIKFVRTNDKLELVGYNTDVIGFIDSIQPRLQPWHQKALVLGTGGAAKAIDYGLRKIGITTKFVSRTPKSDQLSYQTLDQSILLEYHIVINASPVGLYPHLDKYPLLPYALLNEKHLLFDAIYNPQETLFLQKGKEQGATTLNGWEMLVNQAEASWKIWNG